MFLLHALQEQRRKAATAANGQRDWRVLSATVCQTPDCGEPIPEERRRAVPGVRHCIDCAERLERHKK
ncbi:MAG: TraR/DksA C4-type zinc finger protein [Burkholderiales bacterium]|nr:TraR/DksA C4-type zinc finger protein [Burkholderiales bacterium]